MEWLKQLGEFLLAVITNWAAYATGGITVALFSLWSTLRQIPISRKVGIILALVFLFLAFFNAWRDQYRENQAGRSIGSLRLNKLEATIFEQSPHDPKGAIQIGIELENAQNRLIEFHVEKFDLVVEGQQAPQNYLNRGGYAYPAAPTIFRAPQIPINDVSKKMLVGSLEYGISYQVVGSSVTHRTGKNLRFDIYPGAAVRFVTVSESEE